jgi:hypothetical protein
VDYKIVCLLTSKTMKTLSGGRTVEDYEIPPTKKEEREYKLDKQRQIRIDKLKSNHEGEKETKES